MNVAGGARATRRGGRWSSRWAGAAGGSISSGSGHRVDSFARVTSDGPSKNRAMTFDRFGYDTPVPLIRSDSCATLLERNLTDQEKGWRPWARSAMINPDPTEGEARRSGFCPSPPCSPRWPVRPCSAQASPGCDAAGLMNAVGAVFLGYLGLARVSPGRRRTPSTAPTSRPSRSYFVGHQDESGGQLQGIADPLRSMRQSCPPQVSPSSDVASAARRHGVMRPILLACPAVPVRLRRACPRRADPLPRRRHGRVRAVLPPPREFPGPCTGR